MIDPESFWSTLIDWGTVAGALLAIVGVSAALARTKPVRWAFQLVTHDRDRRFAEQAVEALHPILDERDRIMEEKIRGIASDVKEEVRGIITAHTFDEQAGVDRQTEAIQRAVDTANEALEVSKENKRDIGRLLESAGLETEG